jgi:hypothetical protein
LGGHGLIDDQNGIVMEYPWNVNGIVVENSWNISGILEYVSSMLI